MQASLLAPWVLGLYVPAGQSIGWALPAGQTLPFGHAPEQLPSRCSIAEVELP